VIPDTDILERRIAAMRDLPWPIPALTVIQMSDLDLDHLGVAADSERYWPLLNGIVRRIQDKEAT